MNHRGYLYINTNSYSNICLRISLSRAQQILAKLQIILVKDHCNFFFTIYFFTNLPMFPEQLSPIYCGQCFPLLSSLLRRRGSYNCFFSFTWYTLFMHWIWTPVIVWMQYSRDYSWAFLDYWPGDLSSYSLLSRWQSFSRFSGGVLALLTVNFPTLWSVFHYTLFQFAKLSLAWD